MRTLVLSCVRSLSQCALLSNSRVSHSCPISISHSVSGLCMVRRKLSRASTSSILSLRTLSSRSLALNFPTAHPLTSRSLFDVVLNTGYEVGSSGRIDIQQIMRLSAYLANSPVVIFIIVFPRSRLSLSSPEERVCSLYPSFLLSHLYLDVIINYMIIRVHVCECETTQAELTASAGVFVTYLDSKRPLLCIYANSLHRHHLEI
ncbi:hypothetical protein BDN70DRAFT_362493 [Pholiota conissans]|uniref:Uncharacterized protein n=1 Tax=Pholiota conissans TaxID=109636 RepID=A0A9P6CNP1_9AGAR|nr:hypothetical protein BDN70DRAFT_362493 [Pholiota conissans]